MLRQFADDGRLFCRPLAWLWVMLFFTLLLAACHRGPQEVTSTQVAPRDTPADLPWVVMEAGPCLMYCPQYTLTIQANGRVHFRGLDRDGNRWLVHERQMLPEQVRALDAAIYHSGYFGFDSHCCDQPEASDHPVIRLDIAADGRRAALAHDLGDGSIPDALVLLERAITLHAGVDDWIVVPQPAQEQP